MKAKKIMFCALASLSLLATSCGYSECNKEDVLTIIKENEKNDVPSYTQIEYVIRVDKLKISGTDEELVATMKEEVKDQVISFGEGYTDLKLEEGESTKFTQECSALDLEMNKITEESLNSLTNVDYSKKGDSICLSTTLELFDDKKENGLSLTGLQYYNEYNLLSKNETNIYCIVTENDKNASIDCSLSMILNYKK